jgi:hypothetical protein
MVRSVPAVEELGPPATALPLIELGEHACHWPVAGAGASALFCNASRSGSDHPSYCRHHAACMPRYSSMTLVLLSLLGVNSASSKLCPLQLMHVETAIYALLLFAEHSTSLRRACAAARQSRLFST